MPRKKQNKLPKELTTITPLSKTLAIALFILLPIIAFYLGKVFNAETRNSKTFIQVQNSKEDTNNPFIPIKVHPNTNNLKFFSYNPPLALELYSDVEVPNFIKNSYEQKINLECTDTFEETTTPDFYYSPENLPQPMTYKNRSGLQLKDELLIDTLNSINFANFHKVYSNEGTFVRYVKSISYCKYEVSSEKPTDYFYIARIAEGYGTTMIIKDTLHLPLGNCKVLFISNNEELYYSCAFADGPSGTANVKKLSLNELLPVGEELYTCNYFEGEITCASN